MILILDCDNTLYPASSGIMEINDKRINLFVEKYLGLSEREANKLRTKYLKKYGTTLKGLIVHHGVDADEYLDFVHDYPVERLIGRNDKLASFLSSLDIPVVILTSSNRAHAERVANAVGILPYVDEIYDLKRVAYRGKPDPYAYKLVLAEMKAERAVFVDDRLLNFAPAKEFCMITVLVNEGENTGKRNPFAGRAVFREEAIRLAKQKPRLDDFEIRYVEELATIWSDVRERAAQ